MISAAILLALAAAQTTEPKASELLARGSELVASKPAEAVKILQQALRIDPDLPGLRYQLGLAYHGIGDEADAEAELIEAIRQMPDSAEAHNYLGIARFQMGNARGSLEEFRAAAKLAPKDPSAHFNLGEALARTGDSNGALEELRVAAGLSPSDASLTRLVGVVETAMAKGSGSTIKVDVTQILVPAIVTDRDGHRATGLTEADFKIFEDGVEQKITAFSAESSGAPLSDISASADNARPTTPAPVSHAAVRRTYLICLDTLHTPFDEFVPVRESLVKLFQQEHSGDSQYIVIALGASPEVVINVTHDPSAVLAAVQSKRFQKIFLDGQVGGLAAEMVRFRRDLNETRAACDRAAADTMLKAKCAAGLDRVTQQSRQIAELDRTLTVGFLRQFRSLVTQLSRTHERRTIVLISPGFQIEPGREVMELVNAYFPATSHCLVPSDVFCPPSELVSTSRMADEFEPILRLAAASNITVDTIDARGLYGQKAFDASSEGSRPSTGGTVDRVERNMAAAQGNTLAEIAEATGGSHFHDNNNLLGGLQRAFADGREYYMIAYVSANASLDGKFRAISVQVRDRNAVVTAKRGYWAAPAAQ
jgi:VWFA-related protein